MDQKISVRLAPDATAYLTTLQAQHGGSVSDVIRDLIEQARSRQQADPPPAELAVHTHELAHYTASLLTGLVRQVVTNCADADAMISKAQADATLDATSQSNDLPTPIADDEG